jgi:hypothetical protein
MKLFKMLASALCLFVLCLLVVPVSMASFPWDCFNRVSGNIISKFMLETRHNLAFNLDSVGREMKRMHALDQLPR